MAFLVDTDICSAHLRDTGAVTNRFLQYSGQLFVSVLTVGELLSWTLRNRSSPKYHVGLQALLWDVNIVEVSQDIAWRFGELRAQLLDQGRTIPPVDLLVGATAIFRGLTVVTHNTSHFAQIPGLLLDDWLVP
jgi:tRNA(fMet)-specific endonuclease VapC